MTDAISRTLPRSHNLRTALITIAVWVALGMFFNWSYLDFIRPHWLDVGLSNLASGAGLCVLAIAASALFSRRETWSFDAEGAHHRLVSKWRTLERDYAYATITSMQVVHGASEQAGYALTLILTTGKTVNLSPSWTQAELEAIRALIRAQVPDAQLPLAPSR